ncbi:MAG TPA: ABC transporter permease [Acidimicrobiia bacterium]|nr:ABC transporter permease [Acidimicrobiia bacterium]
MRPLTRKLWRDVGRQRAQFLAVTLTVFLGVVVFAASYDSFQNLQASYDRTGVEYRFANLTAMGGDAGALAQEAAALPGVAAVQARTVVDPPLRVGATKLLGRVVGLPAADQPPVNRVKVLQGSYLDPGRPGGVLVEQHMADHFGLAPGSTLEVFDGTRWRTLEVVGVVSSPEYIWPARDRQDLLTSPDNFGVVFAAEALAGDLASGPNQVVVYYQGGEEDPALTSALGTRARDLGFTSVYPRAEQPSNAALSEDIRGFEEMALFFPLLFLAAAAMAAYVMISRLVHAQRPHIGVLRASGFGRGAVLRHYLGYGVLPGLAGAVPGAVAGVLLAGLITRLYTGMLSVPVTVIRFHPATLVVGVVVGVVATSLAALAPALFAARVAPAEAMRGETPGGRGRRSLAERLLPPLRRLPIRWRMVLRGMERNPRRTLYTVLGVVLSLILVLVSWGMIDTVEHLLDLQFREIQRQDASVYFEGPVGTAQVEALLSVPGVAAVEAALEVPASLALGTGRYDTTLIVLEQGTEMHRFRGLDGTWLEFPARGMLVGQGLREVLGAGSGDVLTVQASGFGNSLQVPIAAFVDEPLGTLAYLSRQAAEAGEGSDLPATSALVRYGERADPGAVRAAVTDLPGVAAFEDANALYDTVQRYMGLFYGFVGVMLVFGGAMAFALIFNAMTVNISERSREVATLLALGTRRRTVSLLITVENLAVTLLGIPIGLAAGYWVSSLAMATFQSDMFAFTLYMRPRTLALSALAVVVVALLSGWPGLRALRRLDIPAIVKERSS